VKLLAYVDDIFLLGEATDVAAASGQLRAGLVGVNMEIHADKCKVYAPVGPDADLDPLTVDVDADEEESHPLSLPVVESGCIVLGVPISHTAAKCMMDAVALLDPDEKFPRALAKKLEGIVLLVKHKRHYTSDALCVRGAHGEPLDARAAAARHARGGAGGGRTSARHAPSHVAVCHLRGASGLLPREPRPPPGEMRRAGHLVCGGRGGAGLFRVMGRMRRRHRGAQPTHGGGHRRRVRDASSGAAFCAAAQRRRRAGATGEATHAPFSA
jgi:hypothetical protein